MHAAAIGLAMAATGLLASGATPAAASTSLSAIVSAAHGELGSNGCPAKYHGLSCSQSWCAAFALWAWQKGGVDVATLGDSVTTFRDYGDRNGTWHDPGTYTPQPGDAMIFGGRNFEDKASGGAHVGIVEKVSNGVITEIGGNQGGKVTEVVGSADSIEQQLESSSYKFLGYVSPVGTPPPSPPTAGLALGDKSTVRAWDGTMYTFSRDAGSGHLQVTYLPKGSNWATVDMTNMVGTPASAGGPPATFIQDNGTIGVVTANSVNGDLQMTYLPNGGNWTTIDLTRSYGTPVTGGYASTVIAPDGTLYIFSRGSKDGGHLTATYLSGSTGAWAVADLTNMVGTPASAGGPPATFIQDNGTIGVVTANSANGDLQMTYAPQGGNWTTIDLTRSYGTPVTGGYASTVIAPDGTLYIFSRGSQNGGHLTATYLSGSTGAWAVADLTNMVGTPASAGGSPATFIQDNGTIGVVTANSANGDLQMTYLPNGGNWVTNDLKAVAGAPVTSGRVGTAIAPDGTLYIWSIDSTGATGHLQATYLSGTSGTWGSVDMTGMVGTPAAG